MTRWLRALLACALLVGLAGTAEAVTRGGPLIYARYADSLLLDPVYNDANVDIWILTNLYDTLLQPTADGKGVQPGLASEYQVSDDGLTVTLKMRPDIKFSDGSPITVDDVKFSLDRARDEKNGIWAFILTSLDSVETKGADGVVLHLKAPDPTFLSALATFNAAILPKKPYEAAAGDTMQEKAH